MLRNVVGPIGLLTLPGDVTTYSQMMHTMLRRNCIMWFSAREGLRTCICPTAIRCLGMIPRLAMLGRQQPGSTCLRGRQKKPRLVSLGGLGNMDYGNSAAMCWPTSMNSTLGQAAGCDHLCHGQSQWEARTQKVDVGKP